MASILIFLHHRQLVSRGDDVIEKACWPYGDDLLVVGIIRYTSSVYPSQSIYGSELTCLIFQ